MVALSLHNGKLLYDRRGLGKWVKTGKLPKLGEHGGEISFS